MSEPETICRFTKFTASDSDELKQIFEENCEDISDAIDCYVGAKEQAKLLVAVMRQEQEFLENLEKFLLFLISLELSFTATPTILDRIEDPNEVRLGERLFDPKTNAADSIERLLKTFEDFFGNADNEMTDLGEILSLYTNYYEPYNTNSPDTKEKRSYYDVVLTHLGRMGAALEGFNSSDYTDILDVVKSENIISDQFYNQFTNSFTSITDERIQTILSAIEQYVELFSQTKNCADTLYDIDKLQKNQFVDDFLFADPFSLLLGRQAISGTRTASIGVDASGRTGAPQLERIKIPTTFTEQCIILSQIYKLVSYHREKEFDDLKNEINVLPYAGTNEDNNASLAVEGSPFGLINKMTQYSSLSSFFDATNPQLAHLQPMIRLFKVTPSNANSLSLETAYEFNFDTFASRQDVQNISQRKEKRGFGVGIKSFDFTYDGSNPFSIKKSIKASLIIDANNFDELLTVRANGLRYIDLALKTGTAVQNITGNGELNFRIKAVVGLSVPNGQTTANFSEIMPAVKNNYVTLNLTPVTHSFDFDETGRVKFKIEYYAYIEEYLDKPLMNIFADPVINKRVIARRLAVRTQKENCTEDDEVSELNEFLENDADQIEKDKIDSLRFLNTQMLKNDLIYYLSFTEEQLREVLEKGPFYSSIEAAVVTPSNAQQLSIYGQVNKDLEDLFNDDYGSSFERFAESFKLSGLGATQFSFFFLGDLIDLIMKLIPENLRQLSEFPDESYIPLNGFGRLSIDPDLKRSEQDKIKTSLKLFEKMRFVLGPVEIIDQTDKKSIKNVSFSDIPISLSFFNEWLATKVINSEDPTYPLTQFLNDIMNKFIKDYLNDDSCYSYNIRQKVRVFQNAITSYRSGTNNDNITSYLDQKPLSRLNLDTPNHPPLPLLMPAGPRDYNVPTSHPDKEYHFFVYYAGRVQPIELMTGNRTVDHSNGIFHYVLGKDRGIVKTIQLQKDETPGLKEVRFEQEGYDGLKQLREIYNVNIKTVANVSTFPGTYIFVEPRGFSPSLGSPGDNSLNRFDLTDLGIGGYYMIINSTHEFAAGEMTTSFNARWVQSLDDGSDPENIRDDSDDGNQKKCSVGV